MHTTSARATSLVTPAQQPRYRRSMIDVTKWKEVRDCNDDDDDDDDNDGNDNGDEDTICTHRRSFAPSAGSRVYTRRAAS